MPARKRPTKSNYNNPFERIDHQLEDVNGGLDGIEKNVSEIKTMLGSHRKEEKDNGKRIDALTDAVKDLVCEIRGTPRKQSRKRK